MRNRVIACSVIFYAGVLALLLGALFNAWVHVVPRHLAGQIGHNSEGYLAILVIALWIQFVRERLRATKAEWWVVAAASAAFLALTWWMLYHRPLDVRIATLNEATLAAAFLIPYVQLRRPLPRRLAAGLLIGLLVAVVATNRTRWTTDLAETWGMVILGVAGFDLVDTGILDPNAVTSRAARWAWYAFLLVAPVVLSVAEYNLMVGSTGIIGEPVRWLVRITEAFIFALFTMVFFAVALGRTGRGPEIPATDAPGRVRRHARAAR